MKKLLAVLLVMVVFVPAIGLSVAEGEKQIPIKSVKIKEQKIKIPVNESLTLTVMIKPNGASNTELEWITSDESVCTVENGTIKAIGAGKCNIECRTKDGSKKKAKVAVTVFAPDPPILFRDIPWGSDMATSIEAGDFANCAFYFENPTPYNSWYTVDALNGLVHRGDCQTGYEVMIMNSDIEVAGYKTDYVWLIYAYGYEDGKIVTDAEKAQFVFGQYSFMIQGVKETRKAIKDLTSKLTKLYGKPVRSGKKPEKKGIVTGNQNYKQTVWVDDYGNKVVLSYTDYGFRINYVWNKADSLLKTINEELKAPKTDQSQNTSGL